MRSRLLLFVSIVCAHGLLSAARILPLQAQPVDAVALTGQVTSVEEGPMEGVLVSAKKSGSPITITVVTDRDGRYRYPPARLEPGQYSLRVRATGYDLE